MLAGLEQQEVHLASYDNHLEDEDPDREEVAREGLLGSEVLVDGKVDDDSG